MLILGEIMDEEIFSMVQECTNEYSVRSISANETEIYIRIPKRFQALWMSKLSDLRTTEKEICEHSGK